MVSLQFCSGSLVYSKDLPALEKKYSFISVLCWLILQRKTSFAALVNLNLHRLCSTTNTWNLSLQLCLRL